MKDKATCRQSRKDADITQPCGAEKRSNTARLCDMQQEAIYFRGCYDSVGYLKKAGIL